VQPQKTGEMCGKFELLKSLEIRVDLCRNVAYIITSKITVVMEKSALVMLQIHIYPAFIHCSVRINMSFLTGNILTIAHGLAKSVTLFR